MAQFVDELGGTTAPVDLAAFGGMLPSWPHFPGDTRYRQFVPQPGERPGRGLWRVLEAAVAEREIPVALDTPLVELVTDGDRVIGAIVERGGQRRRITARGGVILASGGFEADPELRDTYLPLPLVSVGHQGNTGDTIRLAQAAGASLWHMSAFFGWLSFVHRDYPAGFTLDVHAPSFIYVDGDGRRFADETGWEVHDRLRALTAYLPRRPNRPRMPGWIVFDEAARRAGPLHGIVGSPNGYDWSPDNSAELAAGWIKPRRRLRGTGRRDRAGSGDAAADPERLRRRRERATRRRVRPRARDARPAAAAAVRNPDDARASPPRRAARDATPKVGSLRPGGAAIDGLFAAGAAGSIWGHLTEHGGGLTDAIVFGRVAGATAARAARRTGALTEA